jgi:hypothetical protein
MILILAKAAGCSWITVKELLLMYVAERDLQPDELTRTFERYSKLTQEAARKIVDFHGRRTKVLEENPREGEIAATEAGGRP